MIFFVEPFSPYTRGKKSLKEILEEDELINRILNEENQRRLQNNNLDQNTNISVSGGVPAVTTGPNQLSTDRGEDLIDSNGNYLIYI